MNLRRLLLGGAIAAVLGLGAGAAAVPAAPARAAVPAAAAASSHAHKAEVTSKVTRAATQTGNRRIPNDQEKWCAGPGYNGDYKGIDGNMEIARSNAFAGGLSYCVTNSRDGPNIRVSNVDMPVPGWDGYDDMYTGCLEGHATGGPLATPMKVRRLLSGRYRVSMTFQGTIPVNAGANLATDIYFDKQGKCDGQTDGAEFMIWKFERLHPWNYPRTQYVVLDGIRWEFYYGWGHAPPGVICADTQEGGCKWHYEQFRPLTPYDSAKPLNLMPFFRLLHRDRQIEKWWTLNDLSIGNEMTLNGNQLHIWDFHTFWKITGKKGVQHIET